MRPLEGIKILDFTHVLAGPFCTRVLADMGADVVKINSLARVSGNNAPNSPYYVMWNRNKRALALNMQEQKARDTATEMAKRCDVVIDNFSLGVLDRWGLGFERITQENEGVIYIQMSGMGKGGPWQNFVTYAPTIHALAGLTYTTGVEGKDSIGVGFSYNDHQAGLHAAAAILTAIEARRHHGKGQLIDFSQFEVGTSMLGPSLLDYEVNRNQAGPSGNKLPYDHWAPHGCYPCLSTGTDILDEKWLAIACRNDEEWEALCQVMGNPEWTERSQFCSENSRYENSVELDNCLSNWTTNQDSTELMYRLQEAGIPAGVVQTGIDLVESDPQLVQHNFLSYCEQEHPLLGSTFIDRLPLYFEKTECNVYNRCRLLGEDNADVLREWLGMSQEEIEAGEQEGAFT